ncbi:MAG: hypothetical protein ACYC8T_21385 [Myxococcaceae bacterium]
MKAAADLAIGRAVEATGPVVDRQSEAWLEITAVMRPRFGPANAWLFNERDKKYAELARRLGARDALPAGIDVAAVESYLERVDALMGALDARGLKVSAQRASTGRLRWTPSQWGRSLRVVDPKRTVEKQVPYAQAGPEAVNPSYTAYLFPPATLSTTENLVARDQPGSLLGALDGALVFAQPPQQSGDSDDGRTETAVLEELFGKATPMEAPALATALGVKRVVIHRGVAQVEGGGPPRLPKAMARPPGVYALVWTEIDGTSARRTVLGWPPP